MSRYLLDTHTFIWRIEDSPKLSTATSKTISSLKNKCHVSLASAWEMAIKLSLSWQVEIGNPFKKIFFRTDSSKRFQHITNRLQAHIQN